MIMIETLIKQETAVLAKEKGFDLKHCEVDYDGYLRPTQSLLQKWLREIHKIDIIIPSNLLGYGFLIYNRYPPKNIFDNREFQIYEEALEVGLQEALKLI